jgi:translation initiation factor 2B subunit (eIF-2B alpha/beta/delta family)
MDKNQYYSLEYLKKDIKRCCHDFISSLTNAQKSINVYLNNLIEHGNIIFTYSNSATVLESLRYVHKNGKKITVYCSESRPKNEGILLARYLSKEGIPAVISTDAALYSSIKKADLVITGADSISYQGITNKIGTYPLAILSKYHEIPCYVLSAEEKIISLKHPISQEIDHDSEEIISPPTEGIIVKNYYFETIPLSLFQGVITQKGIMQPEKVYAIMKSNKVHPYFFNK